MSLLVIPENKLGILSTMKSKTKVFVDVSCLFPRNCFSRNIWVGGQWNSIRLMNLSMMSRVAQRRKWFRKQPRRSWLPCLQSVIAMEIEVPIEPCRYGLLCDQINDLWTKDWFWKMINQLHTKKLWWALTPLEWLSAMKSKIDEYFLKVNGSIILMDLDAMSLNKLDLSKVCLRQSSKSWLR